MVGETEFEYVIWFRCIYVRLYSRRRICAKGDRFFNHGLPVPILSHRDEQPFFRCRKALSKITYHTSYRVKHFVLSSELKGPPMMRFLMYSDFHIILEFVLRASWCLWRSSEPGRESGWRVVPGSKTQLECCLVEKVAKATYYVRRNRICNRYSQKTSPLSNRYHVDIDRRGMSDTKSGKDCNLAKHIV